MWRCSKCGRFLGDRAVKRVGEGYAQTWVSVGLCLRHGEQTPLVAWEELHGNWDPEMV
jgi:hypothetical protein